MKDQQRPDSERATVPARGGNPLPAQLDTLRRVLELERSRGYPDKTIVGGLSAYLRRCCAGIAAPAGSSNASSALGTLQAAGLSYSAWDKVQRKDWAEEMLACLGNGVALRTTAPRKAPRMDSPMAPERKMESPRPAQAGLDSPAACLYGVGTGMAEKLGRLGARTVRDLLYLFPRRHIDYSEKKDIRDLVEGEEQTIIANVWQAMEKSFGPRKGTEAMVGDATGNIRVVWFNAPFIAKKLAPDARIVISGRVKIFRGERLFENPDWELMEEKDTIHAGRLVPVYPLTLGLYPRQMRSLMKRVVDGFAWQAKEFLPEGMRRRLGLPALTKALMQAHFPDTMQSQDEARRRLAFDELLLVQLGLMARKRQWQEEQPGHPLTLASGAVESFTSRLPFALTAAQRRVLEEVLADLAREKPMSRLLQGDVGSGKTVVAAAALVAAVDSGYQGAIMAPTQILAEQHFKTICSLLGGETIVERPGLARSSGLLARPITIGLLTGHTTDKRKGDLYAGAKEGEVDIIIGTHAIIQESMAFSRLALAVVDEQHRFGVMQRSALRQKGFNPHVLVMTATPIPRTLMLTLYGDLDISTIGELPPGRQKVRTRWLQPAQRQSAYEFLRREVAAGHQAFIVCPLIEESEVIEARAAVAEYERLSGEVFPDLRLALLHGRMSGTEKEEVMRRFNAGEFNILVSTAVVEVGIDVPNATVMLVEGADRFGLSQLHQFRGRVGRGRAQSYCMLLAEHPSEEGRERLALIERTYDGFALAEEDLRLRGPGEVFGTRQSGMPDLKAARLSDIPILENARYEAELIMRTDPELHRPEHAALASAVSHMWRQGTESS